MIPDFRHFSDNSLEKTLIPEISFATDELIKKK